MSETSLIPRPKEEEEKGPGFDFQPFAHVLNYLGFNHVLISGRVPMTPSKLHGRLHDVAIHHIKPV